MKLYINYLHCLIKEFDSPKQLISFVLQRAASLS